MSRFHSLGHGRPLQLDSHQGRGDGAPNKDRGEERDRREGQYRPRGWSMSVPNRARERGQLAECRRGSQCWCLFCCSWRDEAGSKRISDSSPSPQPAGKKPLPRHLHGIFSMMTPQRPVSATNQSPTMAGNQDESWRILCTHDDNNKEPEGWSFLNEP